MAKSNIELEQAFYVDGIKYICVGHDNGLEYCRRFHCLTSSIVYIRLTSNSK